MMKKYVEPEAEIVRFQEEDIITTSGGDPNQEEGGGQNEDSDLEM